MIIGITGTNASGKDTISDYLRDKYGFKNYSLSDEIRMEATKMGLEHTRDNLGAVGNDIREKFGLGELSKRAITRVEGEKMPKILFSSIRNIEEIKVLRDRFADDFKLIFVDAPAKIRFERASSRGRVSDKLSLDDFIKEDLKIQNEGKSGQQISLCRDLADIKIINDGTIIELGKRIGSILNLK